jgi:hypothetical protein
MCPAVDAEVSAAEDLGSCIIDFQLSGENRTQLGGEKDGKCTGRKRRRNWKEAVHDEFIPFAVFVLFQHGWCQDASPALSPALVPEHGPPPHGIDGCDWWSLGHGARSPFSQAQ